MTRNDERRKPPAGASGRPRTWRRGNRAGVLWAHGEPVMWLHAGGLLTCLLMIVGLVGLVVYQGTKTFWPAPVVQLQTLDGDVVLGEPARRDVYELTFAMAERLKGQAAEVAKSKLTRAWRLERREQHDVPSSHARERSESQSPEREVESSRDRVAVRAVRHLIRTGNFELTGEHFRWVNEFEIKKQGRTLPRWAVVLERVAWGRFYGMLHGLRIDGDIVTTEPEEVWRQYRVLLPQVARRRAEKRRLERDVIGRVNAKLETARLRLRRAELRHGPAAREAAMARTELAAVERAAEERFASVRRSIAKLDRENARYELILKTSRGEEASIPLADIVRGYLPNQLSAVERWAVYGARWKEFLTEEPREANTEGGVLPAIWGTVAMTLLMALLVLPLGVLAALYLREYAQAGWMISAIRIAVNNLAGIPSIVFGVFGLGFFCYIIGARIDELLFAPRLPSPTFGTGGLLWASLTLALLTLPVVIVATEEALAAVPRSVREGSLACGATKWQTLRRIVLPQASPGILTGMILAMARGAGEVAPLMLVGAVKLAPDLPVDATPPFVHLERSFMHLGFHIYDLGFQSQSSEAAKPMVFTTTLLLITLIAVTNAIAIRIRNRLRGRHVTARF